MADDATGIAERGLDELYKGQNVLGNPSELRLAGTGALPGGGGAAAAMPAPAGPGGVGGGFLGGGRGAEKAGGPDAMGTGKQALEALYKTGKFGQQLAGQGTESAYDPIASGAATVPGIEAARSLGSSPITALDLGLGMGAGAPNVPTTFGDLSKLVGQGLSMEDIQQILGGSEAVSSGAGATSGLSGLSGGLGLASGGGAALGAILGLIASLTGSEELGTAAQGVGGAASGLSTGAALAGGGTGIAGTGATSALGAVAAPAAVLAAPIVGTMLIDSLFSKKGEDLVSDTMRTYQGDYPTWAQNKLLPAERQQGIALQTLQKALPYVKSQEEMGQLLNSYKNYMTTTTGAPLTGGTPEDIYGLGTIAGTGPVTHGQQTPTFDWGPQTQQMQSQIDQLLGVLPGQKITAQYGQPGGGLEGEPARRLWEQFMLQGTGEQMPYGYDSVSGESLPIYGAQPGQYSPQDILNAANQGTLQQQGAWDPATGQWVGVLGGNAPPSPADYFKQAPYMAQLQKAQTATAQQGVNALGGAGAFDAMLSDDQKRAMGLM